MTATVIDQDGNEQTFLAHYWRYSVPAHEECGSPEEAQAFLRHGEDSGELSSCCIVWPDGSRRNYDYVGEMLSGPLPFDGNHCPHELAGSRTGSTDVMSEAPSGPDSRSDGLCPP